MIWRRDCCMLGRPLSSSWDIERDIQWVRKHANKNNISYGYLVNQVFNHITSILKILTLATDLWLETEIHAMSLQQPWGHLGAVYWLRWEFEPNMANMVSLEKMYASHIYQHVPQPYMWPCWVWCRRKPRGGSGKPHWPKRKGPGCRTVSYRESSRGPNGTALCASLPDTPGGRKRQEDAPDCFNNSFFFILYCFLLQSLTKLN